MIRVLVTSDWSQLPPRLWNVEPDDSEWAFFQAHANVGDTVTIASKHHTYTTTYEVLSKDPVPVYD